MDAPSQFLDDIFFTEYAGCEKKKYLFVFNIISKKILTYVITTIIVIAAYHGYHYFVGFPIKRPLWFQRTIGVTVVNEYRNICTYLCHLP